MHNSDMHNSDMHNSDMHNSDKVICVEGLSYISPSSGRKVLKDISIMIGKGEFVGLIGPNGAGKTTLLKCLNGIRSGTGSGSIRLNGIDIRKLSLKAIARLIGYMPQNSAVTFPFPVIDIVLMGRNPHKGFAAWESDLDVKIARKYLTRVDAMDLESRHVTNLSGGELQRVMFARVLAQETEMLLLDEPTASLDIAHQGSVFKYASELCSSGRTIVAAVHDLKIAAEYCSRLILMKDGAVYADGKPEDVLNSRNISDVYNVNALVYKNRITGKTDFYISNRDRNVSPKHIHIIGGGGSASGVIRFLFENGNHLSAGVLAHGDSDVTVCETFNTVFLVCEPFSGIDDALLERNISFIKDADLTILCNMPFGPQNVKNLEAAAHAERLVIIEDEDPETRDFTGGIALNLYNGLKKNAIVIKSAALHEVI